MVQFNLSRPARASPPIRQRTQSRSLSPARGATAPSSGDPGIITKKRPRAGSYGAKNGRCKHPGKMSNLPVVIQFENPALLPPSRCERNRLAGWQRGVSVDFTGYWQRHIVSSRFVGVSLSLFRTEQTFRDSTNLYWPSHRPGPGSGKLPPSQNREQVT